jgi:hypothetical protein
MIRAGHITHEIRLGAAAGVALVGAAATGVRRSAAGVALVGAAATGVRLGHIYSPELT